MIPALCHWRRIKWSEALTLRCGFAYDQTPVSSEDTRVPACLMLTAMPALVSAIIYREYPLGSRLTHIFFDTVKLVSETPDGTLRGKVAAAPISSA